MADDMKSAGECTGFYKLELDAGPKPACAPKPEPYGAAAAFARGWVGQMRSHPPAWCAADYPAKEAERTAAALASLLAFAYGVGEEAVMADIAGAGAGSGERGGRCRR